MRTGTLERYLQDGGAVNLATINALVAMLAGVDCPKWNLAATAAPGVGDDEVDGWEVGSIWNVVSGGDAGKAYRCTDPSTGAAVWVELTGGGGGGDMTKAVYDTDDNGVVDSADVAAGLDDGTYTASAQDVAGHLAATGNPHDTYLDDLTDVDATSPNDADVLAWDANSGTWIPVAPAAGSGDVVGPAGATDGAIALYDTATGKLLKDSGVTLGLLAFYAEDPANHSGLDYAYLAGVVRNDNAVITTPADAVTLDDDTTNYVEVDPATGAVSANTTGYTSGRVPMAEVVTASGAITTVTPARTWAGNEGIALKVPEGAVLQVGDTATPTTSEIRFGDGTYVRLYEPNDDELAIDSGKLTLNASQLALPNLGGSEGDVLALDAYGLWNPVAPGGGAWDGDIADINLDGGTDIGADLADADLILVDDGGAGTNRKCALSRLKTYIGTPTVSVLALGAILTTNSTYAGITITGTVDTNAVGFGALLAQAADFHWDEADADAVANSYGLAVALATGTGSKTLLLRGQVCNTAWNWSAGPVYMSTTQGTFTQTKPTGSADVVIVCGYALSADTIMFDPSGVWVEVA